MRHLRLSFSVPVDQRGRVPQVKFNSPVQRKGPLPNPETRKARKYQAERSFVNRPFFHLMLNLKFRENKVEP